MFLLLLKCWYSFAYSTNLFLWMIMCSTVINTSLLWCTWLLSSVQAEPRRQYPSVCRSGVYLISMMKASPFQFWQWQSEIIAHRDDLRMTCRSIKLTWGIAHSKWYAFEVGETEGRGRLCLVHVTVLRYWAAVYTQNNVISYVVLIFYSWHSNTHNVTASLRRE